MYLPSTNVTMHSCYQTLCQAGLYRDIIIVLKALSLDEGEGERQTVWWGGGGGVSTGAKSVISDRHVLKKEGSEETGFKVAQ